jgi:hypothetical protein
MRRTWGTETSKYPEEKKSTEIPRVVANEIGAAQLQQDVLCQWKCLGKHAIQGESPVHEGAVYWVTKSSSGHEKS